MIKRILTRRHSGHEVDILATSLLLFYFFKSLLKNDQLTDLTITVI